MNDPIFISKLVTKHNLNPLNGTEGTPTIFTWCGIGGVLHESPNGLGYLLVMRDAFDWLAEPMLLTNL